VIPSEEINTWEWESPPTDGYLDEVPALPTDIAPLGDTTTYKSTSHPIHAALPYLIVIILLAVFGQIGIYVKGKV